jgi:hypothetical protein
MRRLLIALITALAACALASPAIAVNPITITDPSGDATSIPDVVRVTIEDAGAGFGFTVELATMQDLLPDGLILVLLDSDRNGQTGGLDAGIDFVVLADKDGAGLLRWNGSDFAPVTESISPSLNQGRFGFTLAKATLGSQKIDVVVIATTRSSDNVDGAPNESAFTYLPAITRLVIPASLLNVRAGAVLNARTVQANMMPVPGQNVALRPTLRCTLTYRGRAIRALAGGCRWRIGAALRGKRLSLRITATVGSESRTQTVTVRVRR